MINTAWIQFLKEELEKSCVEAGKDPFNTAKRQEMFRLAGQIKDLEQEYKQELLRKNEANQVS